MSSFHPFATSMLRVVGRPIASISPVLMMGFMRWLALLAVLAAGSACEPAAQPESTKLVSAPNS